MNYIKKCISLLFCLLLLIGNIGSYNIHAEDTDDIELVQIEDNDEIIQEDIVLNEESYIEQEVSAKEPLVIFEQDEAINEIASLNYQLNDVDVNLSLLSGGFEEGFSLLVNELDDNSIEKVNKLVDSNVENIVASYYFDIKLVDNENNKLTSYLDNEFIISFDISKINNSNCNIHLYHIYDNKSEELNISKQENNLVVKSDKLGYFVIEFSYPRLQFTFDGVSQIDLSTVLSYVGLQGEIEDIEVSDDSILTVDKNNEEWLLSTYESFSSDEWIKVTIDDIAFEIAILDSVSGVNQTGLVELVDNGTERTVALDAPISTVYVDRSKIRLDNVTLDAEGVTRGTMYLNDDGYVVLDQIQMKRDYINIGVFALIYEDACVMSDGSRKNLEIVFNSATVIGSKQINDTLYLVKAVGNSYRTIAIAPLSLTGTHFAFRADVKVRVGKSNESGIDNKDTLLFTATGINTKRDNETNFTSIGPVKAEARANYSYSESMEPLNINDSKIDDESDIYIPVSLIINQVQGKSADTYGYRFVGEEGLSSEDSINYNSGFATVGSAKGFTTRIWSSAGENTVPIEMYLLSGGISHNITSSSGYYGKIELTTSGKWNSDGSAIGQLLYGGRSNKEIDQKRSYVVPNGKEVTYKLTPEKGFIIKQLFVGNKGEDLKEVAIFKSDRTNVYYQSDDSNSPLYGKVAYYTYTFPDDRNYKDQEIYVTWQPVVDVNTEVNWKDFGNIRPTNGSLTLLQDGVEYDFFKAGYRTANTNPATLNSDQWRYLFYNLPRCKLFNEITGYMEEYVYEVSFESTDDVYLYEYTSKRDIKVVENPISISHYADGLDYNHHGYNESATPYVRNIFKQKNYRYLITFTQNYYDYRTAFYNTQEYYDELKDTILYDDERLTYDAFDEKIECLKANLGLGFNFGNELDWASSNNVMSPASEGNRTREYEIRISVGRDGMEYAYYQTRVNQAGNIFNNENRNDPSQNHALITFTRTPGMSTTQNMVMNYLKVTLINHDTYAQNIPLSLYVDMLELVDNNGNVVLSNHNLEKRYDVTIPSTGEVDILQASINVTANLFFRPHTRLFTAMQLDDFVSDYRYNPQGVYDLTSNGMVATDEELDFLYNAGFRSIRLPITWYNHMDSTGTVDPEWFVEINEVVNRIIEHGFYVIVNIHHDSGMRGNGREWIKADRTSFNQFEYTYRYLVLQIAQNFKYFDSHLILEGPNEVTNFVLAEGGSRFTADDFAVHNELLQIFVDEIRSTGYNNSNRFLIVNPINASRYNILDGRFVLPDDSADNKIFVGLHDYTVREDGILSSLEFFDSAEGQRYLDKYNIIIGEYGMEKTKPLADRRLMMQKSIAKAYQLEIPMFVWEDGGNYALMTQNNTNPGWDTANRSGQVVNMMRQAYQNNMITTKAWSDWETISHATATENGLKQRTCYCDLSIETQEIPAYGQLPDSSWDLIKQLNVGWSLGNSLENQSLSYGYLSSGSYDMEGFAAVETHHDNPVTTRRVIESVAQAGFNSIRIPVSFYNHLIESEPKDASGAHPGQTIDEQWLLRVKEVVDWALDEGLYVIINDHHDTGMWQTMNWIYADKDIIDDQIAAYTNIWSQVAEYFKDYDARLIFQSTGEVVNKQRSFDAQYYEDFQMAYELNQAFIDTVRQTGSINAERFLILETYAANSGPLFVDQAFYKQYQDSASNKLIFGVHNYSADTKLLEITFKELYKRAVKYNMPFIVDECGTMFDQDPAVRLEIANCLSSLAKQYGMAVMVWDDGEGEFGLIDRQTSIRKNQVKYYHVKQNGDTIYELNSREIVEAMINANNSVEEFSDEEKYNIAHEQLQVEDFYGLNSANPEILDYGQYSHTHADAYNPVSIYLPTPENFVCLRPYYYAEQAHFIAQLPDEVTMVVVRELDKDGLFIRDCYVYNDGYYIPSEDAVFVAINIRTDVNNPMTLAKYQKYVTDLKLSLHQEDYFFKIYYTELDNAKRQANNNDVLVTWQSANIASGYKVFKKIGADGIWYAISDNLSADTLSYLDTDTKQEDVYYTVKAFVLEEINGEMKKFWTDYDAEGIPVEELDSLELLKQSAKEEIENYKDINDYRQAEQELLLEIIQNALDDIDEALSEDEINEIVSQAKQALDNLKTKYQYEAEELRKARRRAKSDLDNYKDPADYRQAEYLQFINILMDAKTHIDVAGSLADIDAIVNQAHLDIDVLKTKQDYQNAVNTYLLEADQISWLVDSDVDLGPFVYGQFNDSISSETFVGIRIDNGELIYKDSENIEFDDSSCAVYLKKQYLKSIQSDVSRHTVSAIFESDGVNYFVDSSFFIENALDAAHSIDNIDENTSNIKTTSYSIPYTAVERP